jgi:serine/threonine-protein kinase
MRRRWLVEATGSDEELLAEVSSLLEAHERAEGFLSTPAALTPPDGAALEGRRLGSYRILEVIGSGGMGKVFRARRDDEAFQKEVAIKVARSSFGSLAARERFRAEREMLARLEHPHIARMLDGGETDEGLPFLVMELVDGVPITSWVQASEPPLEELLELFRCVCAAVHHAHRNLIVHRDLKPSNILVAADGTPRLLDFGIARLLGEESGVTEPTTSTLHHLTPEFASPEQARGDPMTTGSDVYALGVLLYLLLTGRRPYEIDRARPAEMIRTICETEPPPPSRAVPPGPVPGIPDPRRRARRLAGDLDRVVLTALAKDPERRYSSAEALAEDVERCARHLPIRARPASRVYRLGRFLRRHPVGSAAGALAVSGVILFSTLLAFQAARIARERDRAEREAARATAVTRFLTDTLSSAHPQTGLGRDATVLEALEVAQQGIEGAFPDAPDVEAAVRKAVGETWASLGRFEEAETLLRAALQIQRTLHGERSIEVADTLRLLGDLLRQTGELEEAERHLRRSLELKEVLLGPTAPGVADTLNDYATLAWTRNDYETAARHSRRALAILEAAAPGPSPSVAVALGNLAVQVEKLGSVEESIHLYQRSIDMWRALGQQEHPGYVGALSNLGVLLRVEGRLAEAEPLLRQSLALDLETMGGDHPNVAISLVNLADLLHDRSQCVQAQSLYHEALGILEAAVGSENWLVGRNRDRLGRCLTGAGRFADAERELQAARGVMAEHLGPRDSRTLEAVQHLAELYDAWERPAEAARVREALARAE